MHQNGLNEAVNGKMKELVVKIQTSFILSIHFRKLLDIVKVGCLFE